MVSLAVAVIGTGSPLNEIARGAIEPSATSVVILPSIPATSTCRGGTAVLSITVCIISIIPPLSTRGIADGVRKLVVVLARTIVPAAAACSLSTGVHGHRPPVPSRGCRPLRAFSSGQGQNMCQATSIIMVLTLFL